MSSAISPREIVSELDRFIVGQDDAKRAVAIALRNRLRRQKHLASDGKPVGIVAKQASLMPQATGNTDDEDSRGAGKPPL